MGRGSGEAQGWIRRPVAVAAALALAVAPGAGAGAVEVLEPPAAKAVLVLFQEPPEVPFTIALGDAIRSELRRREGVVVYSEHLDLSRYPGADYQARLRAWLRAKYAHLRFGAIVAVAPGAVDFAMRPEPLWPGVPLVYCGVDERQAVGLAGLAGVTGVVQATPIRETLELAVRLLPESRRVALVSGASPYDRSWEPMLREAAAGLPGGPEVVELFGLRIDDLKARLAALPKGTPLMGMSYLRDGAGRPWSGPELLRAIEPVAPGPVFVVHDFLVGRGVAGGDVLEHGVVGAQAARQALRLLDGAPVASIPIERVDRHRVVLDWRVLERWRVADARIPAGAEVRFRLEPLWVSYPRTTAAVTAALLVQGLLLGGFLMERARRRRAEVAARQRLLEVAHLNRVSTAGELAAALAHEINTPLATVQNAARTIRRRLSSGPAPLDEEVRVGLALVEGEGRRAAEVIRRLRAVLRREPAPMVAVDPAEVVREAVALVGPQARQRGVELRTELAAGLPAVEGDPVQLLQVVINLAVNAVGAVAALPPGRRLVTLSAAPDGGGVRLTVADQGEGFSAEARARLFEPFLTDRPDGLGVGLSISRSIVERHGGRLWLDGAPGGARLHVDLPALPGAAPPRPAGPAAPTPGATP